MAAMYDLEGKRIFVAGHKGMVGGAVTRRLASEGCELLVADRSELDLLRQAEVEMWIRDNRPQAVFLCAATVGGILANDQRPADFLYDNLMIQANVIKAAFDVRVEKLLFLGSSCIYPRLAPQPMTEDCLLTSALEPTNQWYAIAKIAGLRLCEAYRRQHGADFISAMPTNLYGPGDNFSLAASHVVPALMRKAHEAKQSGASSMTVWGTGAPRREFLYVEDLAHALVFLMKNYSETEPINVGTGADITIRELAEKVCAVVGFTGALAFDASKPDGTPRKLLDVSRLEKRGWRASVPLDDGLATTYAWFLDNVGGYRGQTTPEAAVARAGPVPCDGSGAVGGDTA